MRSKMYDVQPLVDRLNKMTGKQLVLLAKESGVTVQTLCNVRTGRTQPRIDTCKRIAEAL